MPIYEYKCEECNKISEILLINKEDKIKCKTCGSEKLTRQFSSFSSFSDKGGKEHSCCGSKNGCDSPKRCCES